jgi:hypothetical protein
MGNEDDEEDTHYQRENTQLSEAILVICHSHQTAIVDLRSYYSAVLD